MTYKVQLNFKKKFSIGWSSYSSASEDISCSIKSLSNYIEFIFIPKTLINYYIIQNKAHKKECVLMSSDLIIYNCPSMSWAETQRVCPTFSWDETEYYSKRSCVYKLKMISCNSTLCLFQWIFISAKSQANMPSHNPTQTQTIVNNQVIVCIVLTIIFLTLLMCLVGVKWRFMLFGSLKQGMALFALQ